MLAVGGGEEAGGGSNDTNTITTLHDGRLTFCKARHTHQYSYPSVCAALQNSIRRWWRGDMAHSSPTAVTSQAGGGGTTQSWWPVANVSRHASNGPNSVDPGSGAAPLPGSSENSRFRVRLDQNSTGHQRWVVPPPPAWLVTAVGNEWTISLRHHRRIEFCKAAHTEG